MVSIVVYRMLFFPSMLVVQEAAPPAASLSDAFPVQPDFVLAPSTETGPDSDPVSERVAKLTTLADQADDVRAVIELRLAAADLALGAQLEPVATRALLGLDIDTQRQKALGVAGGARQWIDQAGQALDAIDPAGGEAWLGEEKERVRRLRAFGDALAAYLTPPGDESAYRQSRKAASGLSVMLEAKDQRIAGAASLWQAALFLNADLADRALSLLDPALAAPPTPQVRPAFFARLLRCRVIAGQGRYATALALLFPLEERCEDWFPVEADRGDALRAVTIVEWQVLRAWHDALTGESHQSQRRWCAGKAAALLDERFTPDSHAVLRLERAIPVLATPPDGSPPDTPLAPPVDTEKGQPGGLDR